MKAKTDSLKFAALVMLAFVVVNSWVKMYFYPDSSIGFPVLSLIGLGLSSYYWHTQRKPKPNNHSTK